MSHTTEKLLLTPSKLLSPMKRLMRQSRSSPYKVEKRTPRKGSRKQLLVEEPNLKNGVLESKIDDINEFEPIDDNLGMLNKFLFILYRIITLWYILKFHSCIIIVIFCTGWSLNL